MVCTLGGREIEKSWAYSQCPFLGWVGNQFGSFVVEITIFKGATEEKLGHQFDWNLFHCPSIRWSGQSNLSHRDEMTRRKRDSEGVKCSGRNRNVSDALRKRNRKNPYI